MKVSKTSNFTKTALENGSYFRGLDIDIKNLTSALQGRVRFGTATDGYNGENLAGQFQLFTSHASANTEFAVAHTIGSVPIGRIVLYQDKAGSLYQAPDTGTAWTSTNVYFKCDVSSVTFLIFLIK